MSDEPGWCDRCWCEDCNGSPDQHTGGGCTCKTCTDYPEYTCIVFTPPERIRLLAEQLGPLLSSHLNARAARRCLAVAHAAHHALPDYDYPNGD